MQECPKSLYRVYRSQMGPVACPDVVRFTMSCHVVPKATRTVAIHHHLFSFAFCSLASFRHNGYPSLQGRFLSTDLQSAYEYCKLHHHVKRGMWPIDISHACAFAALD